MALPAATWQWYGDPYFLFLLFTSINFFFLIGAKSTFINLMLQYLCY